MFIKKKKHPDEDPTPTPEPELVEESRSSKKKKKNNLEDPEARGFLWQISSLFIIFVAYFMH